MSEAASVGDGGLDVLCASAMRAALIECAEVFEAQGFGGVRFDGVRLRFDTSGGVNKRAIAGDPADIFASSLEFIEDLCARNFVTRAPLVVGSSRIAVGVRTGDAAPDVSTAEKFRAALLAAKSIARGDPAGGGTAGVYLQGVFQKLGVLEEVAAKSVLRVGGFNVMSEVAAGRAAFGLTQSTEIGAVEGVRIGAWLPDSLQVTTQYALGARAGPRSERAAKFLEAIASPQGEAIFRAAGFAPA